VVSSIATSSAVCIVGPESVSHIVRREIYSAAEAPKKPAPPTEKQCLTFGKEQRIGLYCVAVMQLLFVKDAERIRITERKT
jgi:hypothetical protein